MKLLMLCLCVVGVVLAVLQRDFAELGWAASTGVWSYLALSK
jgi:hypothetical protein